MAFQWTSAQGATEYQLQIGTTQGGNDVFDSGLIAAQSATVRQLPAGVVLYARVRGVVPSDPVVEVGDQWTRGSDIAFRADEAVFGAAPINPSSGSSATSDQPIAWADDPVAVSYRLQVGTHPGLHDVDDSGPINTNLRMVNYPNSPTRLYATLETRYRNRIAIQRVAFTGGGPSATYQGRAAVARWATAVVRQMADQNNQPHGGTVLFDVGTDADQGSVTCESFTGALALLLQQANVQIATRPLHVCLNPNSFDCHELLEIEDTDSGRWVTLDPTFGLQTLRADSQPATSAEISAATRALNWTALRYDFLTPAADAYVRAYYLDYPLLYVYVYTTDDSGFTTPPPSSTLQYYTSVAEPVSGAPWLLYATQCASGYTNVTALWNGTAQTYGCTGASNLSAVLFASTINPEAGDQSLAGVWQVNRFVF